MKNTMVWWLKKKVKKVGQPILIVDAETEPMASHIIFNKTTVSRPTCYLQSHERHIECFTYPMISVS